MKKTGRIVYKILLKNLVSIELEPGAYTFLWVYSRQVIENYPETKNFRMRIKSIEIDGIDTAETQCTKCEENSSSTRCRNCQENYYFDELTVKKFLYINILENLY